MVKKINTTQVQVKPIKKETSIEKPVWFDDYYCMNTRTNKVATHSFIEKLATEIIEWSKGENVLVLSDFYIDRGFVKGTFFRWLENSPVLKDAWNVARERISSRREIGGATRKYDPSFMFNSMPMYNAEWKEFVAWKAKLAKEAEEQKKFILELRDLTKENKEIKETTKIEFKE